MATKKIMKVGIISQARVGSSRLPRKVLKEISGKPLLQFHLDRLIGTGIKVIVATSNLERDHVIADFCNTRNIICFKGDESDVLARFYHCAKENDLEVIVRVTSDCPLIDGNLIKEGLKLVNESSNRYISNCINRTYPRGFDFEIFSSQMLEEAYEKATKGYLREHVTQYFVQDEERFEKVHVTRDSDASGFRVTVDEQSDFNLIEKLIVDWNAHELSCEEIIDILDKNPNLTNINRSVIQKKIDDETGRP